MGSYYDSKKAYYLQKILLNFGYYKEFKKIKKILLKREFESDNLYFINL